MAVEAIRGCGYRKVGGLYLVGGIISVPCDRLPIPLEVCPVCSQGIKVGRGFTKINPKKFLGEHEGCTDKIQPCIACQPHTTTGFIMLVGEKHYKSPADFLNEGVKLGVSKRIPFIPKDLTLGKTPVYLAHHKAIIKEAPEGSKSKKGNGKMLEYALGIFSAFIPLKVEKLVWEKDLKGKKGKELKKALKKRGIVPVPIPDGDKDHR